MVTPHFPPDSSAGAHRVRLLAPHLSACGWEPTVVTVDPRDYETVLDPALAALVPSSLRVVRARAWPAHITRRFGVGDLGLRSLAGLRTECSRLFAAERFNALFVTIYPAYTALLGPLLKRRFGVPFILDYQDPWVGSWGLTVGGGEGGSPDLRSRLSRRLGLALEPWVVGAANAITAVSTRTYEDVLARNPSASAAVRATLPLGWEDADFATVRSAAVSNRFFDPADGLVHLAYVGTLLPNGMETARALLEAVRLLRQRAPDLFARLRLWFIGTSNQFDLAAPPRVLPIARELGVADAASETPPRVPYLEALSVLTQASGILLLGSTEPHYTASKLYPALLAARPLLAAFHRDSSVVGVLRRAAREPSVRLMTYGAEGPCGAGHVECLFRHLSALVAQPSARATIDLSAISDVSACSVAQLLASVLDRVRVN